MSSVHRLPDKPNWYCFYTDELGKRRCKTTGTTDKKEAVRICNQLQTVSDKARTGRLTEDRARKIIEQAVADVLEASGTKLERKTIKEHFEGWLESFENECSAGTFERYQGVIHKFLASLGAKTNDNLATLTSADIDAYRTHLLQRLSASTVNTHLKVLRVSLEKAVKQNVFDRNPARLVENVDASNRHERRPFKVPELKKMLEVASDDWKTAIYFGIYTGLRLGDIQALTWANLDLKANELTLRTQKTGRVQILPLAAPLIRQLQTLTVSDDPKAPLCASLQDKSVSVLSNSFFEIMASAGLVPTRTSHQKSESKHGRSGRRQLSEISFHSLRHTATSLLKNAGVSDVIARDIIGHESAAVSRNYTHVDMAAKRKAVAQMVDVTKETDERPRGRKKK